MWGQGVEKLDRILYTVKYEEGKRISEIKLEIEY